MRTVLKNENIDCYGVLPFSACTCRRPDIIERRGVSASEIRSAVIFLVPYYVNDGEGNISLYARSGDYHAYCDGLFERILPVLEKKYGGRFVGFADKSPIEENIAAAKAGLGVIGDNYMLISERYGSFVFLAEILSTVEPGTLGFTGDIHEIRSCLHCGACRKACPAAIGNMECLSALTQKKGEFTPEEKAYLRKYGSVWGCDICQLVCPMNRAVLASGNETPIGFFKKDRIAVLTSERLEGMTKEEFRTRSFSWRGKGPLRRNLAVLDE